MAAEEVADAIRDAKPAGEARPNGHDRETGERRIRLVPFAQIRPQLSDADLVAGLLGTAQEAAIIGAPSAGKTFLALDIGLHVAVGRQWLGKRVKQGPVVYVAAEGGTRIVNRVHAWKLRHRPARPAPKYKPGTLPWKVRRQVAHDRGNLAPDQPVPFFILLTQIDLCATDDDLNELIAAIREACDKSPSLIVIDTLARVLGGGDENSSQDMGAVISAAGILRDEFGACILLVHHFGKDERRGGRGWSGLRGAIDTEIEVKRDEAAKLSTATVTKQRDGEDGAKFHFALETVTIGENEITGDPVTSAIVVAPDAERVADAERDKRKLTRAEKIAFDALKTVIGTEGEPPPASAQCPSEKWVHRETWRQRCYGAGISNGGERARRDTFQRASEALLEAGLIGLDGGFVWPC